VRQPSFPAVPCPGNTDPRQHPAPAIPCHSNTLPRQYFGPAIPCPSNTVPCPSAVLVLLPCFLVKMALDSKGIIDPCTSYTNYIRRLLRHIPDVTPILNMGPTPSVIRG